MKTTITLVDKFDNRFTCDFYETVGFRYDRGYNQIEQENGSQ